MLNPSSWLFRALADVSSAQAARDLRRARAVRFEDELAADGGDARLAAQNAADAAAVAALAACGAAEVAAAAALPAEAAKGPPQFPPGWSPERAAVAAEIAHDAAFLAALAAGGAAAAAACAFVAVIPFAHTACARLHRVNPS